MRGSVTAELAVVLPALTALLAVLLLCASAGMLQLRLEEGARAGARALARGDSPEQVMTIVSRVAGENTSVSLGSVDGYATVTVQGQVGGVLSGLVPWEQHAQASARVESGDGLLRDGAPEVGLATGGLAKQPTSTAQRAPAAPPAARPWARVPGTPR